MNSSEAVSLTFACPMYDTHTIARYEDRSETQAIRKKLAVSIVSSHSITSSPSLNAVR